MRDEKEGERQVCKPPRRYIVCWDEMFMRVQRNVQRIKDRRAAKEERERFEKMAERMHRKRVERVRRREKRNKLLKS